MFMKFDYFYEEQADSYSFYRIPKILFSEEIFESLTTEAKVLYGLLLDRISLSRENGWLDEEGRVFVYCTIEYVKDSLQCANTKACGLLKELDDFGLIERRKQGLGKPSIIYVKNFTRFLKSEFLDSEKQNSGLPEIGTLDIRKSESNKTNINNTELNKTDPILSGEDEDEREAYRQYLTKQLELEILYERYLQDKETLDAISELILDVLCSKRKTIRIAGDDKPAGVVKAQFMKLNSMHIEYVMDCMNQNPTKVRNIKQYLLAAIYNAPLTMQSYYRAWVNHDMATGKLSAPSVE